MRESPRLFIRLSADRRLTSAYCLLPTID